MDFNWAMDMDMDLTWIIIFLLTWFIAHKISAAKNKKREALKESITDHTVFSFLGDSNYCIKNSTVNGKRIPDVEVVNKMLYIDGVFKRKVARNSTIYNRGTEIYVDGKFVG